jgi:hypothetical protein
VRILYNSVWNDMFHCVKRKQKSSVYFVNNGLISGCVLLQVIAAIFDKRRLATSFFIEDLLISGSSGAYLRANCGQGGEADLL